MTKKPRAQRGYLPVLLTAACALAGIAFAGPAATRELTVSEGLVNGNDRSSREVADVFAERIELGRDFKTKRGRACSWYGVPKGYVAENHVNIVDLRFGNRLELLAFIVDEDNTVSLAARAPALYQDRPWFTSSLSPGDFQWPDNAPADLVARFAHRVDRPVKEAGVYHLVVNAMEAVPEMLAENTLPGNVVSAKRGDGARILPLAAAAMAADGFRACLKPREDAVVLNVQMGEMTCAIHAVLRRGDKPIREITRYGIRYEGLYDALRILFLDLIEWDGSVVDWFRPGYGFEPLQAFGADDPDGGLDGRKTILVGMEDDGFAAVDVATGERLWSVPFEERGGSGAVRDGQMFLRTKMRLTRLSSAGEREFRFDTANADRMSFWGDLCSDGWGHDLRLLGAGEETWSKVLPWTILAGPRVTGRGVVLGDAKGQVRCFTLEGKEDWKLDLPRPVRGEIYADGSLFFAVDQDGVLYAIGHGGTLAWQAKIGDVMTGPPQTSGDAIVVGSKSGQVFLFDRHSGKALGKREFKTWLLGYWVAGDSVVCVTLGNRLHVLNAASLEQEQVLRFPFELNPHVLSVQDFHYSRARGGLDERVKVTGWLLSDVKGHVYVFPGRPGTGGRR